MPLYIAAVYLYIFLQSHYILIFLTLMTLAPVFSVISALIVRHYTDVTLTAPSLTGRRNDVSYIKISLTNRSFLLSMSAGVHIISENTFYKAAGKNMIEVPERVRGTYDLLLPLRLTRNGNVSVRCDYIIIRDIMGFIDIAKKADTSAEITVIPEKAESLKITREDTSKGVTEAEETEKKGHDFSDVSDVREYIPGDRLNSIHWKLSAKRDILMVKDRESMSDEQMALLLQLSGDPGDVDEVIAFAYNVTEMLVREGTYVRFIWWNEAAFKFEVRKVTGIETLEDSFADMYMCSIYEDPEKVREYMRSVMPSLKAYVEIKTDEEGQPGAEVVDQS